MALPTTETLEPPASERSPDSLLISLKTRPGGESMKKLELAGKDSHETFVRTLKEQLGTGEVADMVQRKEIELISAMAGLVVVKNRLAMTHLLQGKGPKIVESVTPQFDPPVVEEGEEDEGAVQFEV